MTAHSDRVCPFLPRESTDCALGSGRTGRALFPAGDRPVLLPQRSDGKAGARRLQHQGHRSGSLVVHNGNAPATGLPVDRYVKEDIARPRNGSGKSSSKPGPAPSNEALTHGVRLRLRVHHSRMPGPATSNRGVRRQRPNARARPTATDRAHERQASHQAESEPEHANDKRDRLAQREAEEQRYREQGRRTDTALVLRRSRLHLLIGRAVMPELRRSSEPPRAGPVEFVPMRQDHPALLAPGDPTLAVAGDAPASPRYRGYPWSNWRLPPSHLPTRTAAARHKFHGGCGHARTE